MKERLQQLIDTNEFEFLKTMSEEDIWKFAFAILYVFSECEERTGHWRAVYQGDEIINYRCIECELGDTNGSTNLYGWDYCRRCGAKMVDLQESQESGG